MAGRPTKCTPELTALIVETVRAGNYFETAAQVAGVSKQTLYDWLERGQAGEPPFAEFLDALKKAEGEAERDAVVEVKRAEQNWQAHAWYLERRFPAKYGRRDHDHALKTKLLETELETLKAKLKLLESGQNPDAQPLVVNLPEFFKPKNG